MPLEADADEVPFNLFFELTSNLLKETGPFVLLALALEILPLQASLDLLLVDSKETDAIPLQPHCVVRMGHQIEVHHVFRLHELAQDILTEVGKTSNHEIVSVDQKPQEER